MATVSNAAHAEDARAAGAHVIIDRYSQEIREQVMSETGWKGADRIVEVDFGGNFSAAKDVVAENGAIAGYATKGNPTPTVPFGELMRKNVTLEAVLLPTSPHAARQQAQRDILRWLQEAPGLHRIAGVFPLAETADAHKVVEAGGKRGTVIVEPHR